MTQNSVLIQVQDLKKHFPIKKGLLFRRQVGNIKAVDGISFSIREGETLGLVGESGCGKSTTGRTILRLDPPTSGRVCYRDQDLAELSSEDLRRARRHMQMIFQDPYASLDPRMTVSRIVAEPLNVHKVGDRGERRERVKELMNLVGLKQSYLNRYPHEFSGGERQRIGVARALALQPEFIVCDEPISSLDVSIQAQVINLLGRLQELLGLTYLFIAHDLSVVRHISDRTAVMYLGKLVELGLRDVLYGRPVHPYTQSLISAVPIPNPRKERRRQRAVLKGDVPSPANSPSGCYFHPRCPIAEDTCAAIDPEFREVEPDHWAACHLI